MKTLSKQKLLTIFAAIIMSVAPLAAQVTIGAGEKPAKGALLDLKDHSTPGDKTTATKGLLLPKVNLTNLKPASAADLPASIGNPTTESWNLEDHIGLVVFNIKPPDQCASEPIPVGSFVWSGTEWEFMGKLPEEAIASGVTKHPAKPGVYEEFYYADFGPTAGIWMTTNLTAWAYDDGSTHSENRPLTGPNANAGSPIPYNTAYWSYPKPAGTVTPGEAAPQTWDSRQGLLYTWDAATAGKGGSDGRGNIYNTSGGTWGNNESGYPEGTGTQQQEQIQGICPDGWHLPSDWEWTELERAIISNKSSYSSAATSTGTTLTDELTNTTYGVWQPTPGTNGILNWRGLTTSYGHGNAMKSPCPVPSSPITTTSGLSKPVKQNGFEALLAGFAKNGSANFYGSRGYWWSASSDSSAGAWGRYVFSGASQVGRSNDPRDTLFSVRCKKD
jgi:hypothetical protein